MECAPGKVPCPAQCRAGVTLQLRHVPPCYGRSIAPRSGAWPRKPSLMPGK
jgi:hypothetical protein